MRDFVSEQGGAASRPIGWVRGGREEPIDDDRDKAPARIELDPEVLDPDATAGLIELSQEVVYLFDRGDPAGVPTGPARSVPGP